MKILKYVVGSIMVGGAIGAKSGEYLSTLLQQSSYQYSWINSAMIAGTVAGFILSLVVILATSSGSREMVNKPYAKTNEAAISGV